MNANCSQGELSMTPIKVVSIWQLMFKKQVINESEGLQSPLEVPAT